MTLPGINLYSLATKIISRQAYTFFSSTGRTLDSRGIYSDNFAAGVALSDSIQPVPRTMYESLGLDLSRYYIMVYTDSPLLVIERGTSGDQIEFNGDRYELQTDNDWRPQDGWRGVLAVRLPATVAP